MNEYETYAAFCASHPLHVFEHAGMHWEYLAGGRGVDTVVLLPGGFGRADTPFQFMLAFERTKRVVSITYPPQARSAAALADGLVALLRHAGIERATLVGGSYSGLVVQYIARRYPDIVQRLVLSHTTVPQPQRQRWLSPAVSTVERLPMPLVRLVLYGLTFAFLPGRTPAQRFWRGYFRREIGRQHRASLFNRFWVARDLDLHAQFNITDLPNRPPILILGSAGDHLAPASDQHQLQQLYPWALCHIFDEHAHTGNVTDPEAEIALIQEFMRDNTV